MHLWRFADHVNMGPSIDGAYNFPLVILSFLVASLGGFAALEVVERLASSRTRRGRLQWLAAGAVAMGAGIWSMHFIGMLAFALPVPVSYDLTLTLVSMLPAVFASAMALHFMDRARIDWRRLNAGGLLMAVGIGGMHYTGMEAMRADAMMRYDPMLFVLSLVVAHLLATQALHIKFVPGAVTFSPLRKAGSAAVMGGAVALMHYTAMQAAEFHAGGRMGVPTVTFEPLWMAVAIAVVTLVIIAVAIVATLVDRRMSGLAGSLVRSEELSRLILESAGEGIFGTDADGRLTFVNPAAARMLGSETDALLGRPVSEIWSPAAGADGDVSVRGHALLATLADGSTRATETERWRTRDGLEFPVAATVTALRDNGTITGAVVTFSDITARLETERALVRASEEAQAGARAKSEFLANMSHEIRTPLNGVIGMTGVLLGTPLSVEQREFAETIRSSADHLLGVVNDILDFSRIESGRLTIELVSFDLGAAIGETAELLAPRAEEKGIELIVRIAPDTPRRVLGDSGRVRQVLLNLAGNAVKFTERGQVLIDVALREADAGEAVVRFRVEDTGIGIEPARLSQVFERFTQADASTTRQYGGAGLGLAISKQLVELMGGSLGATSTPGQGSVFWFDLPLAVDAAGGVDVTASEADLADVRVLIVDDNAVNRRVLHEQVAAWRMRNGSVASGAEALQTLAAAREAGDPYRVAILDHQMPGMDGLQLARAIRTDGRFADLMLVLLTSSGQRKDALGAAEVGFAAYLTKPARPSVLLDAIASAWARQGAGMPRPEPISEVSAGVLAAVTPVPSSAPAMPRGRWHGSRVLVAEDNRVNQKVAIALLARLGCQVDIAATGREAVQRVFAEPYDLVFMDCEMPDMDGYAATREIRRREGAGERRPIVAMTAHVLPGDRERCLAAGMDDYITKPVRPQDLDQMLSAWIRPPSTRREPRELPPRT
jgi:PAS domain S-box-containing protein